ncbi:MAG: hypothetical protein AMXMBFR53_21620 [Gemmatimonadota bacterium]
MKVTDGAGMERSPWGVVVVAGSLGCLVGGILWPGFAETLLRVLLASLALGWAAARALGMGLPAATVHDTFSPFEGTLTETAQPPIPDVVERRARPLVAIDDPRGGPDRPIPWPVLQSLAAEARRRLERRRRPGPAAPGGTGLGGGEDWTVPLARLDDILDDLEKL